MKVSHSQLLQYTAMALIIYQTSEISLHGTQNKQYNCLKLLNRI